MKVRVPKKSSLRKYGLLRAEWLEILRTQGNVCAICKKLPPSGRMVTDHEHVLGWKKMPWHERKKYVRGILDWVCNHYAVGRGVTLERARATVAYLEAFERKNHENNTDE